MKRGKLNPISKRKLQELIDQGKSIPASSFGMAQKLAKKTRQKVTSRRTWYKGVQHGSQRQVLVFQNYELIQMAGEIAELEAEVDYTLDTIEGRQVGMHRVDIQFIDLNKKVFQVFNVKADFEEAADELSKWKRRHFLKQYPVIKGLPVRYDFYFADEHGGRVFFKDSEILEALGQ